VNIERLKEILKSHQDWLNGSGGERADLRGAYLGRADLRSANLRSADLRGAYLGDADLGRADLRGAYLGGAEGILRLPVGDPRGYDAFAHWKDNQWRVGAGCRYYTIPDAREHWGESYEGDREIGDRYLYALEWLEKQPTPATEED
jgi:hypothetical protein